MCQFASFILTKDREYWSSTGTDDGPDNDSHENIVSEYGLKDLDMIELVRVELLPSETPRKLSTWKFMVDQDVWPHWTFRGDPDLEKRAREALARRATKEGWFAEVIAHQAVAGYAGIATSDDNGSSSAGDGGTATAGYAGTATAGDGGVATAGKRGTVVAGDHGTATAGYCGTAIAGYCGTAIAGYGGTATAGNYGTAIAGYGGTATAGNHGILSIRWWDGERYRIATFYVGENGIEPNTPYGIDNKGQPVKR